MLGSVEITPRLTPLKTAPDAALSRSVKPAARRRILATGPIDINTVFEAQFSDQVLTGAINSDSKRMSSILGQAVYGHCSQGLARPLNGDAII